MSNPLPPLTHIPPQIAAVADYEAYARERVSEQAWAYLTGGAADEITLRANREAFDRLRLQSRALVDFSGGGNTRVALFGQAFDYPILLAPVAYQQLAHTDGERAAALGAAAAGAGLIVSTHASVSLEEIARVAGGPLWFQLYVQPDRGFTRELVQRAEAAGYRALVVTVDAPVGGVRNREQRAEFRLPTGVAAVNTPGQATVAQGLDATALCGGLLAAQPTWRDLEWLQSLTALPVIVKGVMSPDDAARAAERGVAGVVVSNHGGRTLDTQPASIAALPRIAEAAGGRMTLLLDGGIRRGTDVLKALALGASAVLVGRPYIWGLAAAGSVGVAHVLSILRAELEIAMALTGCATVAEIDSSVLWRE
jgi:4-hydroxymandelate oxidase